MTERRTRRERPVLTEVEQLLVDADNSPDALVREAADEYRSATGNGIKSILEGRMRRSLRRNDSTGVSQFQQQMRGGGWTY